MIYMLYSGQPMSADHSRCLSVKSLSHFVGYIGVRCYRSQIVPSRQVGRTEALGRWMFSLSWWIPGSSSPRTKNLTEFFFAAEIVLEALLSTLHWTPLVGTNQPSHLCPNHFRRKEQSSSHATDIKTQILQRRADSGSRSSLQVKSLFLCCLTPEW